ncbi:MarR family winged helix-turn-helix transcriptional regulator [Phaeobacter porticola]|uniref:Organic hydroperoxide resistance transcriptional regulator n=1 Tax=Phaeobacter porticola TaxID=1844006 RepID=A0A1L3I9F2_9RHOB|nr:MarR family transcriptional regulator [Phaeobacter porticola]APG48665.1 organic hydroperoxide resistance transcriptional regulator [Phaeobacter porticola]
MTSSPDPSMPDTSDLLCFAIYSANHALTRLYRPLLAPLGLTYPQYLVLISLNHHDRQTISALGDRLDLETNTLTPLLKRMEAAGLLSRVANPEDDRSRILQLSDQGRELVGKAGEISACAAATMGGDLEELFDLRDRINALRARLGAG